MFSTWSIHGFKLVQKTLPKLVVIIWFGLVQIVLAVNFLGGIELGNCKYGIGWIIGDYNNLASAELGSRKN